MADDADFLNAFKRLRWLNKAEHGHAARAPIETEAFDLFLQIGAVIVHDLHRIADALEERERRDKPPEIE
jgi:hypothetical protein